jgi:hypothetical protein
MIEPNIRITHLTPPRTVARAVFPSRRVGAMKNGPAAGAFLRKEVTPGRLRPPAASFVSSRNVVVRLELQPLPEPVTSNANQDKTGNNEDDLQHAGSDAGTRDKVQMAARLNRQDGVTNVARDRLSGYIRQLNQPGVFLSDDIDLIEIIGRGTRIRTLDLQYPKLPRYQAALYPDNPRKRRRYTLKPRAARRGRRLNGR